MLQNFRKSADQLRSARRVGISKARKIGLILAMTAGVLTALPGQSANARRPMVVQNDGGGSLIDRVAQIKRLRQSGDAVEIRGHCMSACTMYLGLRNTCVSPKATLGFHGPSSEYYGVALPPKDFEHWSRVMASHYPEPLRSWYLREGRNIIVGFHRRSGRSLIRMGVPRCA